jgi:hypothetical protein
MFSLHPQQQRKSWEQVGRSSFNSIDKAQNNEPFGATGHAIHAMLTYNVNLNLILHLNHKVVQSNLSYVTFQGNVEIWSHNTGGR